MLDIRLNLRGRPALVVGGGAVGRRKARSLMEAGAAVRVVDPADAPADWPADLPRAREPFHAGHLDGVFLAWACATEAVNAEVVAVCRERGVLVGDAARPERGDFTAPAVARAGPVTVAVSAGSPAVARSLRDWLGAQLDESVAAWATLHGEFRQALLLADLPPAARSAMLAEFARLDWLQVVRERGPDAYRHALTQALAGPTASPPPPRHTSA